MFKAQRTRRPKQRSHRYLRHENLEDRIALSASPTVADVNISSSQWSTDFIDYLETNGLGTGGYSVPTGSSQQTTLPWTNIDQVKITFNEDVDIQSSDLSVSGVNTIAYAFSDFSYDSSSYTAEWTLNSTVSKDKLRIDLNGDGLDPVTDLDDNILDGEWTDNVSTYPSGDGTAGGDFEFRLNVLPGDVNGSNQVTIVDYIFTRSLNGRSTGDAGYVAARDVDGSGTINSVDYWAVYGNMADVLPAGDPAGVNNDAPNTQGFDDVTVDEDAADEVLSLWSAFDDAEDADSELTYEVLSNDNPALFDSVTIDAALGQLTLDYADEAHGNAELVIRATDSGGLIVDTPISVQVNSVNDAPVISDFIGADQGSQWVFSGTVADVDHDPTGWVVTFSGVLDGYTATVEPDGTFEIFVVLPTGTTGYAYAQTEDDLGLESNLAEFYVDLSK